MCKLKTFFNYEIMTANNNDLLELNDNNHYYNNPSMIVIKKRKFIIGTGTSDNITVFKMGQDYVLLSTNYQLDYAGIQILNFSDYSYENEEIFFDNMNEIKENLNLQKEFFDYSKTNQCKILLQWIN